MKAKVIERLRADIADFEKRIERSTRSAADNEVQGARVKEIEQRRAIASYKLVPVIDSGALEHVIGLFATNRDCLPARFTRDMEQRQRMEILLDQLSDSFVKKIEDKIAEIKQGLLDHPRDDLPAHSDRPGGAARWRLSEPD